MSRITLLKCKSPHFFIVCIGFLYLGALIMIAMKTPEENDPDPRTSNFYNHIGEKTSTSKSTHHPDKNNAKGEVIAVLVLVCDRVTVKRTLDQLRKYRPSSSKFPLIVSQDCDKKGKRVKTIIKEAYGKSVTYLTHPNYKETLTKVKQQGVEFHMQGYYLVAVHYRWALDYVFDKLGYNQVIIVEDDLDIAPDFFEYFKATLSILKSDPSLWCVSAFNDNGMKGVVDESRSDLLYRTDFFPGLGWMLTKKLWMELRPKWPDKFWDDWMRVSEQRKGRACIHPEISRTKTYGRVGVSNGQFFDKYLGKIVLNSKFTSFRKQNLSYLRKDVYDISFIREVNSSTPVSTLSELHSTTVVQPPSISPSPVSYRLLYHTREEFTGIAGAIGIMDDFKDGVPRNGYMGIVPVFYGGKRLYLVPAATNATVLKQSI